MRPCPVCSSPRLASYTQCAYPYLHSARYPQVFSQIDVDGDGLVTEDELLQFLCRAGVEPDEMSALFASLDVDKDDSITPDEFEAGFSAYKSIIGGSVESGCASDALAVSEADEEEGEEGTQLELRQPRTSRNKKGKLLTSSEVFVRIRPKADEVHAQTPSH